MNFVEELFKFIAPYMFLLLLVFSIVCLFAFLFKVIRKHFKAKSRNELEQELHEIKAHNEELEQQISSLTQALDKKNEPIKHKETQDGTLIHIGTIQIKVVNILYIVSQSFEQLEGGNSRIKVIHYINSDKCDSVYSTFENIIEQLPSTFMMINKNQLINLNKISKIQGLSLHLEGIKEPFYISETKKEEFNKRMKLRESY